MTDHPFCHLARLALHRLRPRLLPVLLPVLRPLLLRPLLLRPMLRPLLRPLLLLASLLPLAGLPAQAAEFLDPEQAFTHTVRPVDDRTLALDFAVAPGYHLYRDRLQTSAEPEGLALGDLQKPAGVDDLDTATGKTLQVYKQAVTLTLALPANAPSPFKLLVASQGCADRGLCYPPATHAWRLQRTPGGWAASRLSEGEATAWQPAPAVSVAGAAASSVATSTTTSATTSAAPAITTAAAAGETSAFASALQSRSLLTVAGAFLLAGLLLSFTPCVLPMIPILSSIIVGQGAPVSRGRGFSLAVAYALGMAVVYTAFGMAAGLMGEGLAGALQNAWVLGGFALLLGALSLSMFGAYELQMPHGLQNRLTAASGRLQGGRHLGVLLMGGLSALIVGPCVAAPLAGALVYISQTRDMLLGGAALFALACGMSVPLLLVGLSAGTLLPRAGGWMVRVKHFFGGLLLAVALWMVSPVLPAWALMAGVALLLLATAVYLGAFERLPAVTPGGALGKAGGLLLAALAGLLLLGLASGGRSLLQPLAHLRAGGGTEASAQATSHALRFAPVADLAALQQAVATARQPVMVDFYADWCVACKEFESLTLSDSSVQQALAGYKLLRVDVTANNAADKALMREYGLFGPPALLFMPPGGPELASHRVIGFQDATAFRSHLAGLAPRWQAAGATALR